MNGSPEQYADCDLEIWLQMRDDEERERELHAELFEDYPYAEFGEI